MESTVRQSQIRSASLFTVKFVNLVINTVTSERAPSSTLCDNSCSSSSSSGSHTPTNLPCGQQKSPKLFYQHETFSCPSNKWIKLTEPVCYFLAKDTQQILGRYLELQKCNIHTYINHNASTCCFLICMHSPLGAQASCILMPVVQSLYVFTCSSKISSYPG